MMHYKMKMIKNKSIKGAVALNGAAALLREPTHR